MEMWIARNENNSLVLYIGDKPIKDDEEWMSPFYGEEIALNNLLFPEVKWSDTEPTKVKLEIAK